MVQNVGKHSSSAERQRVTRSKSKRQVRQLEVEQKMSETVTRNTQKGLKNANSTLTQRLKKPFARHTSEKTGEEAGMFRKETLRTLQMTPKDFKQNTRQSQSDPEDDNDCHHEILHRFKDAVHVLADWRSREKVAKHKPKPLYSIVDPSTLPISDKRLRFSDKPLPSPYPKFSPITLTRPKPHWKAKGNSVTPLANVMSGVLAANTEEQRHRRSTAPSPEPRHTQLMDITHRNRNTYISVCYRPA
jgi:hypothetical protein